MDEKILNLLNDWAIYSNYDREQNCFRLNSWEYEFNKINKRVEYLLEEYDETGILSIITIKQAFKNVLKQMEISLFELFKNHESAKEEILSHYEMYQKLHDKEILEYENQYYKNISLLIQAVLKKQLLEDKETEEDDLKNKLANCTDKVLTGLKKCHLNVYKKGGIVGKITKISTQIYMFPSIAECLFALEKAEDGMYLTFINVANSPDSFFGFFVKSNGNLFSFDERIPEVYRGSHQHSRTGRWTEGKADEVFPYEYIFNYSNYDYKGYSRTYQIDEEKLAFLNLGEHVYIPLLLAMIFVARKFSEKELENNIMYVDSILPVNLLQLTEDSTELIVMENTELAKIHKKINLNFDLDKILKNEYDSEFLAENGMNACHQNQIFVDMYGNDFTFDINDILRIPNKKLLTDKKEEYYPEFIGNEQQQRLQAFYVIRQKLAQHIRNNMKKELDNFGGIKEYQKWFEDAVLQNKNKIEEMIAERYFNDSFQRSGFGSSDKEIFFNIYCEKDVNYPNAWKAFKINEDKDRNTFTDERTGAKCTIFITIKPKTWKSLESILGDVPKLVKGWKREGHFTSGNSILDVTDAVEAIGTPFEQYESSREEYQGCYYNFDICIGYSKRGFKQMLKEFSKN